MATLTLSVDRSALSLAALVFDGTDLAASRWIEAMGRPGRSWQKTYASSPYLHGAVLTEATLSTSSLEVTVGVRAGSSAALETMELETEAAFSQFVYQVTVTENGQAKVWQCDPADISWSSPDPGAADAHLSTASLTIPVYPIPGT